MAKYRKIGAKMDSNTRNDINYNFDQMEQDTEAIVGQKPAIDKAIADSKEAKTTADSIRGEVDQANVTAVDAVGKAELAVTKSDQAVTVSETVRDEFDQVVAEAGSNNPEVVHARGEFINLKGRLDSTAQQLADKATQTDFNANDYGADPNADWTVNRDAFQAANDAAFANGGGRVVAKTGIYEIKGLIQDANVEFYLPGVVFKNPDGLSPDVVSSRVYETIGSISTGETELTVTDASNIVDGSIIAIHHAGGILNTQFSALSQDITPEQTDNIKIDVNNGTFPYSGYFQVGEELIGFTSLSGTTLVGVTRGALGTTPASHSTGDHIGVARHLYAEVTKVVGNVLTLNVPAVIGVSNSVVSVGIMRPKIEGLTIDGNRIFGGSPGSTYGVNWSLVRWGIVDDFEVVNGDMGGLMISNGSTECSVNNIRFHDVGVFDGTAPKGAGLWLYQGCKRNRITNFTITGRGWVGIYMDDRTARASYWNAPNDDNVVNGIVVDLIRPETGYPPALNIVGGSRNKFMNGFVRGTVTGVDISNGGQHVTADGSVAVTRDNEVSGIDFDVRQPWVLHASGNRLHNCTYSSNATSIPIAVEGNLVYAVTTVKGEPVNSLTDVKFPRGTASSPGIAFLDDTGTGFYKDGNGLIHVTLNGVKKFSFYGSEFRLDDGVNMATGNNTGTKFGLTPNQKIGFHGRTPIAQQANINNLPADATLQQVRDAQQMMIVTLRNLGLISMT